MWKMMNKKNNEIIKKADDDPSLLLNKDVSRILAIAKGWAL